jgi:hypothetical protein
MNIDESIMNLKNIEKVFIPPSKVDKDIYLCTAFLSTKNIEAIRVAIESLIMQKRLAEYRDFDICEWQEDYDWDENNISEYHSVASVNDFLIDKLKGEEDED